MKTSIKAAIAVVLTTALGAGGIVTVGLVNASPERSFQLAQANDKEENEEMESEEDEEQDEQAEAAQLQSLAKITPQQAQQAAEAAAKGKASSVELEEEDGSLVYKVAISQQEVIVDAGNGRVLYTENENQEENEAAETARPRSSIQVPDTDNEQEPKAKQRQ